MFGAVAGLLGFSATETRKMYLYMYLRDTLSAATRLNLLGPLEAAKLQRKLGLVAENLSTHYELSQVPTSHGGDLSTPVILEVAFLEAASGAPVLEVLQASHDFIYSRLFSS
jgi:urease accessory protein